MHRESSSSPHWLCWGELGAAQQAAGPSLLPRWRMSVPAFCLCHSGFGDPKGQTICPSTLGTSSAQGHAQGMDQQHHLAPGHSREVIPGILLPPSSEQFSMQTQTHSQGVSIIYHWINPELPHWAGGCAGQPEAAQSRCSASSELIWKQFGEYGSITAAFPWGRGGSVLHREAGGRGGALEKHILCPDSSFQHRHPKGSK